jgi:hypothetical protein
MQVHGPMDKSKTKNLFFGFLFVTLYLSLYWRQSSSGPTCRRRASFLAARLNSLSPTVLECRYFFMNAMVRGIVINTALLKT